MSQAVGQELQGGWINRGGPEDSGRACPASPCVECPPCISRFCIAWPTIPHQLPSYPALSPSCCAVDGRRGGAAVDRRHRAAALGLCRGSSRRSGSSGGGRACTGAVPERGQRCLPPRNLPGKQQAVGDQRGRWQWRPCLWPPTSIAARALQMCCTYGASKPLVCPTTRYFIPCPAPLSFACLTRVFHSLFFITFPLPSSLRLAPSAVPCFALNSPPCRALFRWALPPPAVPHRAWGAASGPPTAHRHFAAQVGWVRV